MYKESYKEELKREMIDDVKKKKLLHFLIVKAVLFMSK